MGKIFIFEGENLGKMMAGIDVTEEAVNAYKEVWKRKARYVIYKPNADYTKCEVEHQGERAATFDSFKELVPK